jgi:hypothetical protein
MSHGSHDTHAAHPREEHREKPKPEPILKERKGETVDAAREALEGAQEFLQCLGLDFQKLFGELKLEEISPLDLRKFIGEFDDIVTDIQHYVDKIQEDFDQIPEAMRHLFTAVDFVAEQRKKEKLETVKLNAEKRREKLQKEKDERDHEQFEKWNERLNFVENFENSGLSVKILLDVVSKIDSRAVINVTDDVIANYETEPLSPATKHKIFEEQFESGEVWEEIKQHENDVQIIIDEVEAQRELMATEQRFQINPQNQSEEFKKLRQSFQLMQDLFNDPQRVGELTRTNKLSEAEAVRDEASKKLSERYKKELEEFRKKEEQRIDQEVDRLQKKKFEKRREEEKNIRHDVQKDVPEQILKEVMRSSIDLKVVSVALAERILKEKHGIEYIDMDLVFTLPESVIDALVDTLSYADIAKFIATSKQHPENLPPIYWSKSFEKKYHSLTDRFTELESGGLFVVSEDPSKLSKEKEQFIENRKQDFTSLHKAYQRSNIMGDHKGQITTSGKYNDFFVPELERLFEMRRIQEALCGKVDNKGETTFVVDGQKTISQKDGHLFVEGKPFPDSKTNTGSAPLNFHRLYGYTAAERVNDKELPNVDFKKAVDWLTKLYGYQVIGKSAGLFEPILYRKKEAEILRTQAEKLDQKIESISLDLKRKVESLKNSFEPDIQGFERTKRVFPRAQLVDSNNKDLRNVIVEKTKEIQTQFQSANEQAETVFQVDPKKSVAERQLLDAKHHQFDRRIKKLENHSYRPVERVVAMTEEDYKKGYEFYKERSSDLTKEGYHFNEAKEALEKELKEKTQKLPVIESVIYENVITDHQWRFWERRKVGKSVELVEIKEEDPVTHVKTYFEGFAPVEKEMKKKEFEALKAERDAIKERIIPNPKKKNEKTPFQIDMENLIAGHQKRKQEIQKDIDHMLQVFPLIPVVGDSTAP